MVVQEALPDQPDAQFGACRRDALVGKGFGQPVLCQPSDRWESLPWRFAADTFRGWASALIISTSSALFNIAGLTVRETQKSSLRRRKRQEPMTRRY